MSLVQKDPRSKQYLLQYVDKLEKRLEASNHSYPKLLDDYSKKVKQQEDVIDNLEYELGLSKVEVSTRQRRIERLEHRLQGAQMEIGRLKELNGLQDVHIKSLQSKS